MANEVRLIDANAAMLNTYNDVYWTESEAAVVRSFLVHQPTIDPESLRPTGRWELGVMVDADYYTNCLAWICSCCDYRFADKSKKPKSPKLNYCPSCGAKMEV